MVRVLVTVEPRMYREAIALAVHSNRPKAEVMLVSEEVMDGQVKEFAPTCSCATTLTGRSRRSC
jgi:hypothetical protein